MSRIPIKYPLLLIAIIAAFWSTTSLAHRHGYPGYRSDYQVRGGVVRGAVRGAVVGSIVGGGDPRATQRGAAIGAISGGIKRSRYNNYYGGHHRPYYR